MTQNKYINRSISIVIGTKKRIKQSEVIESRNGELFVQDGQRSFPLNCQGPLLSEVVTSEQQYLLNQCPHLKVFGPRELDLLMLDL